MMRTLFLLITPLLLLSGCKRSAEKNKKAGSYTKDSAFFHARNNTSKHDTFAYQKHDVHFLQQHEARLIDVPLALGSKVVPAGASQDHDNGSIMLWYTNKNDVHWLVHFYEQEMERNGWKIEGRLYGNEIVLHYTKPQRFCTIMIRPYNLKTGKLKKDCDTILIIGKKA